MGSGLFAFSERFWILAKVEVSLAQHVGFLQVDYVRTAYGFAYLH